MELLNGAFSVTGVLFFVFCLLLVVTGGLILGRVNIKGVAFGDAGVFLMALLFGCFLYGPLEAQLSLTAGEQAASYATGAIKLIETLGLVLFVTAVGFAAGPDFFDNLKRHCRSYVLLSLVIVGSGTVLVIGCMLFGRARGETDGFIAMMTGLFAGALTSTPAFSAAKSAVDPALESMVSVGYGIAYIFGVVGKVMFIQVIPKLEKADIPKERERLLTALEKPQDKKQRPLLFQIDPHGLTAFALAAAIGILVGSVRFGSSLSLTTTGGCLLVALLFGHFGRIGRLSLVPPEHTLKLLRELGLLLFLLGAGISGGTRFVEHFKLIYFVYGVVMTVLPLIIGYVFARHVLKLGMFNALGSLTGGMTSTPALGSLIKVSGTEAGVAAYAATYPVSLVMMVLVCQLLIAIF